MTFAWYVGIDWGGAEHEFRLLDASGRTHGVRRVAHDRTAVLTALAWIRELTQAVPADIAVGLETPHGVLVDTLIDQGFAVFAANPKQIDRFRDRFTMAGAKDDRLDALVVGDTLRTDPWAFQAVHPTSPQLLQLRELSRIVEDLQQEELRLTNRLREQLGRVDAAWLQLSPAVNDAWVWDLLADAPHPAQWARLPRRRIAAVLREHRIRRVTPDEVVTQLQRPRLTAATGIADAVESRVAVLVPQLRLIRTHRLAADRRVERLLAEMATPGPDAEPHEHRDVEILRSLPGAGRMVTATMLTDAAGPLAARDYDSLRALAGAAPVTKRSGKRRYVVQMRYACKRRLRVAVYHWARISLMHDRMARAYYDRLRSRGHGHARALRSVADRWLRILMAMLRTRTLYDPARWEPTEAAPSAAGA